MTDPFEVARGCSSKTRYSDEAMASAVAAKVWNSRKVELRVYACTQGCGGFHLTKLRAVTSDRPGWRPPRASDRYAAVTVDSSRDHEVTGDGKRKRNRKHRRGRRRDH